MPLSLNYARAVKLGLPLVSVRRTRAINWEHKCNVQRLDTLESVCTRSKHVVCIGYSERAQALDTVAVRGAGDTWSSALGRNPTLRVSRGLGYAGSLIAGEAARACRSNGLNQGKQARCMLDAARVDVVGKR